MHVSYSYTDDDDDDFDTCISLKKLITEHTVK